MFRDVTVGTDTYMYLKVFEFFPDIEIGFKIFATFIKNIGGDFVAFLSLFFFLSFLLKIIAFKSLSNNFALSFLIYSGFWFLVYDINAIRQGLALGFVAMSFVFLNNKNMKMFYVACFLACVNHYSAAIFLPFGIIVNKIKCSNKLFLVVFFTVLILSITQIAQPVIAFLSNFLGGDNRLVSRAQDYQRDELYNSNILYSFSTFTRILILFITFFALQKIKINERLKNILLWSALLNISFYLIFSQYELIATRLSLYYRFGECFFFSFLPEITKYNIVKFLIGFLILCYILLMISQTLSIKNNNLEPYKSVIFN